MSGSGGLTLAVTSSTGVIGLAVGRVVPADGPDRSPTVEHLAEIEVITDRRHAEEISPGLNDLLDKSGIGFGDLDRLVVDIGPGRFTGLRVGMATVRALGFALDLPVIGVTSLAVLARGQRDRQRPAVTAVIDARRSEVFQQTFIGTEPVDRPVVGRPEELAALARGVVIGDGADHYAEIYESAGSERDFITDIRADSISVIRGVNPRAATMVELSVGLAGTPGSAVQPLYLRDPDAKPNIRTRVGTVDS